MLIGSVHGSPSLICSAQSLKPGDLLNPTRGVMSLDPQTDSRPTRRVTQHRHRLLKNATFDKFLASFKFAFSFVSRTVKPAGDHRFPSRREQIAALERRPLASSSYGDNLEYASMTDGAINSTCVPLVVSRGISVGAGGSRRFYPEFSRIKSSG